MHGNAFREEIGKMLGKRTHEEIKNDSVSFCNLFCLVEKATDGGRCHQTVAAKLICLLPWLLRETILVLSSIRKGN